MGINVPVDGSGSLVAVLVLLVSPESIEVWLVVLVLGVFLLEVLRKDFEVWEETGASELLFGDTVKEVSHQVAFLLDFLRWPENCVSDDGWVIVLVVWRKDHGCHLDIGSI